jgi:energy-coupling factor transporter ATP-binding protein EcfA2
MMICAIGSIIDLMQSNRTVLVTGPSGFGKTRLSKRLADATGRKIIHLDDISYRYVNRWLVRIRTLKKELTRFANLGMIPIIEGVSDNVPDVIALLDDPIVVIPLPPVRIYRDAVRLKANWYRQHSGKGERDPWVAYWMKEATEGDPIYKAVEFIKEDDIKQDVFFVLTFSQGRPEKPWD